MPTSGFAYSLEALSEDEDADEEDNEEGERTPITQEQLAAALQVIIVKNPNFEGQIQKVAVQPFSSELQPTENHLKIWISFYIP